MTENHHRTRMRPPCPVTKKVRYKNAGEAQRAIADIARVYHAANGLAATPSATYRCRFCKRWHVTNMDPVASREFRLARIGAAR